jgi:hypothetical protein
MSFHVSVSDFCSMIDPCALFYLCVALRWPADASTAALPLTLAVSPAPRGEEEGWATIATPMRRMLGPGGGGRDGGRRAYADEKPPHHTDLQVGEARSGHRCYGLL